jgi:hypothetical protein
MSPCPEGCYLVVQIITQLRFDDTLDRTDRNTLRRIMMTLALDAGFLIDNIGNAVTLVDRLGGTFGYAGATSDAIFGNFHGHGCYSVHKFGAA